MILVPDYVLNFTCIGDKNCTYSCCRPLTHGCNQGYCLDHETQLLYKNSNSPIIDYENNIIESSTNAFYRTNNECCCYLTADGLCDVITHHGLEYLSKDCMYFPRIINLINEHAERSAHLNCPEMARLCLFRKEPIVFHKFNNEQGQYASQLHRYRKFTFAQVQDDVIKERDFILQLMQNREYTVSERLSITRKHVKNKSEIYDLIDIFDTYHQSFVFREFSDQCGYALNITRDTWDKFKVFYEKNIDRVTDEYSYVFENYCINQILAFSLPFHPDSHKIIDHIINEYHVLRIVMLIMMHRQTFTLDAYLDVIVRIYSGYKIQTSC